MWYYLNVNARKGFFKYNYMGLINYIKETRGELKHVSWPTKKQSLIYTVLVVFISIAVAAYVGFFDYVFTDIFKKYLLN